jgi:hypothetical protein
MFVIKPWIRIGSGSGLDQDLDRYVAYNAGSGSGINESGSETLSSGVHLGLEPCMKRSTVISQQFLSAACTLIYHLQWKYGNPYGTV